MATGAFHVLYESASGYALFSVIEAEEVGALLDEVQQAVTDLSRFQRTVKLVAFQPFTSAENALENMNAVTEHALTDDLKNFLELKLGKSKKKKNVALGVASPQLGTAIQETLGISCKSDEVTREIIRGVRMHFNRFIKELDNGMLEKAQLGLGHSYSRAKVKFNPGRADNMIIQAIALLDQLDKDINTFAMRVREWYCWHFPELRELVKDNYMFARCAAFIRDRNDLTQEKVPELAEILGDEQLAEAIFNASRHSMGMDTTPLDMQNIVQFTTNMVRLAEYRKQVYNYLVDKMTTVAPNLSTLIGETVAARLIQKAGSLTSLAKAPASTVQILGAEKALFRALKTRGNTPKYGLIYHSTFIGRASTKNKGRISRYLANKCAIASRIDSFIEEPTNKYGEELREQVEERLKFYDTGEAPRKNVDVMQKVAEQLRADEEVVVKKRKKSTSGDDGEQEKKKKKKKKQQEESEEEPSESEQEEAPKKKKKKKSLSSSAEASNATEDTPKKKKKKNRA